MEETKSAEGGSSFGGKKLLRVIEVLGALILVGGVTLLVVQRIRLKPPSAPPDTIIQLKPGERLSEKQITMLFEESAKANSPKLSEVEIQKLITAPPLGKKLTDEEIKKIFDQQK